MLILGLTNRLPNNLFLYFNEYDDTQLSDVLEEANFLSSVFDIDLYVLESSRGSYHVLSLDILSGETVARIQRYGSLPNNYMTLEESPLYGRQEPYCVLRIGSKATKDPPKFVKGFYRGNRPKSFQHYIFYKALGLPEIDPALLVNLKAEFSIYNGGIGAKPKRIRHKESFFF